MSEREFDVPPTDSVQVSIFNQTYSLRSNSGGERIRQIAELVDERMQQIASRLTTYDVTKIAILAALNIADELQSFKDHYEKESQASILNRSDEAGKAQEGGVIDRQEETDQQSWFDAIFDTETLGKDRSGRLSSQVSAKLQSRRQAEPETPAIEAEEPD